MSNAKFRGKRADNGQWVYGYYFTTPLTDENSGTNPDAGWFFLTGNERHCISQGGVVFVVDEQTVCQYTGLKDKKDVEIYEHDLLMTKSLYRSYNVMIGQDIRDERYAEPMELAISETIKQVVFNDGRFCCDGDDEYSPSLKYITLPSSYTKETIKSEYGVASIGDIDDDIDYICATYGLHNLEEINHYLDCEVIGNVYDN